MPWRPFVGTRNITAPGQAEEGQSSIGLMTDSQLDSGVLVRGAEEVLPKGRLAEQLEQGKPLRVKLGIDPTAPDIHLGLVVVLT